MNKQHVGCNAFILNNREELLLLKRSEHDDAFPGEWELPGGGVDVGETPQEAVRREVREECGLTVEVLQPISVNSFYIKDEQVIEITFLSRVVDDKYQVRLSHEHSDFQWVPFKNIADLKLNDYIDKVIGDVVFFYHGSHCPQ